MGVSGILMAISAALNVVAAVMGLRMLRRVKDAEQRVHEATLALGRFARVLAENDLEKEAS